MGADKKGKNSGKLKKNNLEGKLKKIGGRSFGDVLGVMIRNVPRMELRIPLGGIPVSLNQIQESN